MKVTIFYGSLDEYRTVLPSQFNKTLVELALFDDERHKHIKIDIPGEEINEEISNKIIRFDCVVGYSDDYASLTEHTIESFTNFILRYEINDLYLQNPPDAITKYLKQLKNVETIIIKQQYHFLDMNKLKKIKKNFAKEIIGQEIAQEKILATLYNIARKRYKKPCVILFYGDTGIGKTETAKYIANCLNEKLFRKQFSMFHSEEFANYIFGGKHNQSSLAKELLERTSNVILFDEFDKPHPTFYSAFYQLFDEGVLTDRQYTVEMKESLIICTSNFKSEKQIREQLGDAIYSRFDAIIGFNKLNREAIEKIIDKEYDFQYKKLNKVEKEIINESMIKDKLLSFSDQLENARQIKRIIREIFGSILVKRFL